jgi:hypothetical protein
MTISFVMDIFLLTIWLALSSKVEHQMSWLGKNALEVTRIAITVLHTEKL